MSAADAFALAQADIAAWEERAGKAMDPSRASLILAAWVSGLADGTIHRRDFS